MSYAIDILKATRANINKSIDGFTLDQLNYIPEGFNNNLMWHYGHIVITQQLLCYKLAGLATSASDELIAKYKKGSKPDGPATQAEFDWLKAEMTNAIERLEADLAAGIFKNYKSYTTSYNMTLTSINEAVEFNNTHEAMHFGNILSMKKLV